MIGRKERSFAPLINVSLKELVAQDHFYRHLERTLDLSFVREFVQETMQPAHVSLWLRSPQRHTEEPRHLEKPNTVKEGF
jgi:hypothetical protein